MRRLLSRKAVTIITAIISFTTIPAVGIVATATPALASVRICLTMGNGCVGAPTIDSGDPVVLTATGRSMNVVDQHFTCCGRHEVFQLQFASDTTKCAGVASTGNITVRDCSGGNTSNVNWAKEPQGGSVQWFSNTFRAFLTSDNVQGDQLFVSSGGSFSLWSD